MVRTGGNRPSGEEGVSGGVSGLQKERSGEELVQEDTTGII